MLLFRLVDRFIFKNITDFEEMTAQSKELVNNILSLPSAPDIIKQVHEVLEKERARRTSFYNEISEFEKAEFINGEIVIHSPKGRTIQKRPEFVSGA